MSVSPDVRAAEAEIDGYVDALPIWKSSRSTLVRAVLSFCSEGAPVLPMLLAAGEGAAALDLEGMFHAGVFRALRWSLLNGAEQEEGAAPSAEDVFSLLLLGARYETLVDVLRQAKNGLVVIEADTSAKRLRVYEGGDRTGFDHQLVEEQRIHKALSFHLPLTDDDHQLTRRWTAGDYRALGEQVSALADCEEAAMMFGDTVVGQMPAVITAPRPRSDAEAALLRDLTISRERLLTKGVRLGSWLDTPFVEVDGVQLGVTSVLKTVFTRAGDDYMLRLAALVDPDQYSLVSGTREQRMIAFCERELKALGWETNTKRKLANPEAEIDIEAIRDGQVLVLELKSTLRPESPAEVRNRNVDLIRGINQVVSLRERLGEGSLGFLVTDGYEGDFETLAVALTQNVPLVTLQTVREWGRDARATFDRFVAVEAERTPGSDPLPDREDSLGPWTLVLVDRAAPV